MVMARMILGLIMAVTTVSDMLIWHSRQESALAILWLMASAPLFVAAVTVLVITFVKFEERNGRYVLDQDSWIAQLFSWDSGTKVTICLLFWATVLLIIATTVIVFMLTSLVLTMFQAGLVQTLVIILEVVVVVGVFVLFFYGIGKFAIYVTEKPKLSKFVDKSFPVFFVVFVSALIVFLAYPMGVWHFLKCAGIAVAVIAGAVGLIFLAIRFFGFLRKSTAGKILTTGWQHVKSRTCPIVSVVSFK